MGTPWTKRVGASMSLQVPLFDTDFGTAEVEAVADVVRSGWLTMGDTVRQFEQRFAAFIGVDHAVAVASATAGLHLVLHALEVGDGDEVICPSLNFVAGANVVRLLGAHPALVDIANANSLMPDNGTVWPLVGPRTRAIQVMHYGGCPIQDRSIYEHAKARGIPVVEDCSHAPGATLDNQSVGTFGTAGVFSFFSNKNLSTGEGGMVVTGDQALAERVKLLRSHGMSSVTLDRHRGHAYSYDVSEVGYNYRMDEMHAALGLVQLEKLPAKNARRTVLRSHYESCLQGLPGLSVTQSGLNGLSANHLLVVLLPVGVQRETVMQRMRENGIQTSIHYPPIHQFSAYHEAGSRPQASLPETDRVANRLLTLPLYPTMTEEQVELVCTELRATLMEMEGRPSGS